MALDLDMVDMKILKILKENSRTTYSEISKMVLLSVPAVAERIRKLEAEKVISQYTLKLNRKKFGLNILAFIFVSIDKPENSAHFRETIRQNEWVLECHHIAGEYDYLLKVLVESTDKLEVFITHILKKTMGVAKTNAQIVLSTVKEDL